MLTRSLLVVSLVYLTGCASMYRQRDDVATKQVKKAAVVAFIAQEPASSVFAIDLGGGGTSMERGGSSFYQTSPHADTLYKEFSRSLAQASSWQILSLNDVGSNPFYTEEAKKLMAPVQVMFLPKSGENWFTANKIMVPKAAELGGRDSRNRMMAALNVDALIIAEVRTEIAGGFTINGFGPRKPVTRFDMKVYRRDQDEPIWLEGGEGEKSKESLGWIGPINEDRLKELSKESVASAFAKIGTEIK